jgi:hypothetical protein
MAFDFPASPTVGQTFTPAAGVTYTWNGYAWAFANPTVIMQDTPPASPASGTLWLETDTGTLFMWYVDVNSSQWISVGAGAVGAPLNSPIFTGDPQAPTPVTTDNDTSIATTAFTQAAVNAKAVRYDAAQGLTLSQKGLALANIGAAQYNLVNGKLIESHAANAATFVVKTLAGNDPSTTDPVVVIFPDASVLSIVAGLSLTIPDQKMFGAAGVQVRLWFALANDAGTPRLVVRRCSTAGAVKGFDPRGIMSIEDTTFASSLTNCASVSFLNRPYRIIAFADYETAIPSNGSWTISPTRITMVGPATPLPGAVIQTQSMICASYTNCNTGVWVATQITQVITPYSLINPIQVECYSDHHFNAAATYDYNFAQMFRNDNTSLPVGATQQDYTWSQTTIWGGIMYTQKFLDFPYTTAQTRYRLFGHLQQSAGNYFYLPWAGATLTLQEIMG